MQTNEKRRNIRRTLRYPGVIEIGDDAVTIQCALRDASQEGAQLQVDDPESVPNEFTLILGYDGNARRRCRVVWRSENLVGVEFKKPSPKDAPRQSAKAPADATA